MVMLQIRHVPEDVHRELKVRAAHAGTSLSEYVLAELIRVTSRPTLDELRDRVLARDLAHPRSGVVVETGEQLAREHDEREQHLAETTFRRPTTRP
jgi:plasmid stability protein